MRLLAASSYISMKNSILSGHFGRIIASFALVVSLLGAVSLQGVGLPSVDQIIEKNIKGMGGKAAIEKVKTRVLKGSISNAMTPSPITWEMRQKAPNKRLAIMEMQGFGKVREVYDGKTAWTEAPGMSVQEKTGEELARVRRDAEFYRELRWKELYPHMTVLGQTNVAGRTVYQVEAKPATGTADVLYFDAENGLLLRMDSETAMGEGKVVLAIYFEDYKVVDGVKVPHLVRMPAPEQYKFTLTISEVKFNVPMEEAEFAKAGGK